MRKTYAKPTLTRMGTVVKLTRGPGSNWSVGYSQFHSLF